MAHPKGEDKRLALLEVATTAFVQSGIAASAAVMARNAGVAEGTLFRYFTTKDDLVDELYLFLKQDLCQSMMASLDRSVTNAKAVTHYIWNSYINWGLNHTYERRTIRRLVVSEKMSKKVGQQVDDIFPELHDLCHRSVRPEFISDEYRAFGDMLFLSLVKAAMEFAARDAARVNDYISVGFEAM